MEALNTQWRGQLIARLMNEKDCDYEEKKSHLSPIRVDYSSPLLSNKSVEAKHTAQPLNALEPRPPVSSIDLDSSFNFCALDLDLYSSANGPGANPSTDNRIQTRIHLNRSAIETVQTAFRRLGLTLWKRLKHKKDKHKSPTEIKFHFTLPSDGDGDGDSCGDEDNNAVLMGQTHRQLWTTRGDKIPKQLELTIRTATTSHHIILSIVACPVTIKSVRTFENFKQHVFVGVPLLVRAQALYPSDTIRTDWYVDEILVEQDCSCYVPRLEDVNKEVVVVLTPKRDQSNQKTVAEAYRFHHCVQERPNNTILDIRQLDLKKPTSPSSTDTSSFRVLSYNILADLNAFSEKAQTYFYPYCDSSLIVKERRFPLILHEILEYQADIVCLQEVDTFVFSDLLKPTLTFYGYQGYYSPKAGTREGPALFWSLSTFESVPETGHKSHEIRSLFQTSEPCAALEPVQALLARHTELDTMLCQKLGHILQTVTLTPRTPHHQHHKFTVANTHLFYHPRASHIRLLQMLASCLQIERECGAGADHRSTSSSIIFCGDFNSSPTSGAAKLLFNRVVRPTGDGLTDQGTTWKHLYSFAWERDVAKTTDSVPTAAPPPPPPPPTLALPLSFPKLVSGYFPELPEFTHYIENFVATLDYIMLSEDLEPIRCARMPTTEEVTKDVAMPSAALPSDHVSLLCDFRVRRNDS